MRPLQHQPAMDRVAPAPHPLDTSSRQGIRFRLAPTPSGYLHEGNLYNFLLNEAFRQALGGSLLLRIDDLDRARFRPVYLEDVFFQLDALGIAPDLGPSGPEEFERHWSQRHRQGMYEEALERLRPQFYACSCSRADWKGTAAGYPGHCRRKGLILGDPDMHWRIHVPEDAQVSRTLLNGSTQTYPAFLPEGDPILRNREGHIAYQLASVVDDLHFGVTAVVRGMDLLPSSGFQYWLADQLAERMRVDADAQDAVQIRDNDDAEHAASLPPDPSAYALVRCWHHPLALDGQGNKLSKSTQSSASQGSLRMGRRELRELRSRADRDAAQALGC
jgi:glutamyl/glutaminyl-tRNA synthetase